MNVLLSIKRYTNINLLGFIVIWIVLQSCTFNPYNYTYIQTPVNVTDLQKKGDARVDGYVWANHADAQASYALGNHMGVIAGYNQGFKNTIQYGELGGGYFSSAKKKIRIGLFAGGGIGTVSVDYKNTVGSGVNDEYYFLINSQYNKFFIQPYVGIQVSEKVLLTSTFRLNYVRFNSYSYLFQEYDLDSSGNKVINPYDENYHYETNTPHGIWILDPSSTITVNVLKNISFIGTINYSMPLHWSRNSFEGNYNLTSALSKPSLSNTDIQEHPVYSNLGIHIGLRFRINILQYSVLE